MVANKTSLQYSSNVVHTTNAVLKHKKEENTIFITYQTDVNIMLDDAEQEISVIKKFIKNEESSFSIIMDIRNIKSIDREAREHYKKSFENQVVAIAIIIDNPISQMIGNIFIGFNTPKNASAKLFRNYKMAISWLNKK